jgi:uncharacterized protein YecT (DUF1311 family)
MSVSCRLAALATAVALLASADASAMDDYLIASSSAPTLLKLCGKDRVLDAANCKARDFDALAGKMDEALQTALAKAPANVRPLLKRDQAWFDEIVVNAAQSMSNSENNDDKDALVARLQQRTATLGSVGPGFGRPGFAGRWVSAFGNVTVTPAEGGAYRLTIDLRSVYSADDDHVMECRVAAQVAPAAGGWLTGTLPVPEKPADGKTTTNDAKTDPVKPPAIKMRRQGETLRIVVDYRDDGAPRACGSVEQLTASYFASGNADSTDKSDTSFSAPTFDCTRPETASDEEICADPDLAENDQKLNRAWKALSPRLDEATRRALTEDQRHWVQAQAEQYPEFLHPAWNKQSSFKHFTAYARDRLNRLQRERIALLEGFDEKRNGIAGLWLSYTAVLKVTVSEDRSVTASGWKWDQGDWKAGCDFDMEGSMVKGVFRSDEERTNPDTLERDHAMLIVNRQDDSFAKKRFRSDGNGFNDEPKCRRNGAVSSTARLFPVRPSPDIDNPSGAIR